MSLKQISYSEECWHCGTFKYQNKLIMEQFKKGEQEKSNYHLRSLNQNGMNVVVLHLYASETVNSMRDLLGIFYDCFKKWDFKTERT